MLFGSEKYNLIYNRIIHLIEVKGGITYVICHKYAKIKIDFYGFLLLEKKVTFHNVIILINSVFNTDKNNNYCNIFFEKASFELPKI